MSLNSVPRHAEDVEDEFDDTHREPVIDHGELSPATRRALLQLLNGPYLSADGNPKLWPALIRDEALVRARLADLYLDLELNHDTGVAFIRNLDVEDAPRVVRSHPLTLLDTVLVLYLRRLLLANHNSSARTFVGRDEIEDQLRGYRPADMTDKKGFDDRIAASIRKMRDKSVLLKTPNEDRWEITPVLALIFGPEEVAAVTADLERLARP